MVGENFKIYLSQIAKHALKLSNFPRYIFEEINFAGQCRTKLIKQAKSKDIAGQYRTNIKMQDNAGQCRTVVTMC